MVVIGYPDIPPNARTPGPPKDPRSVGDIAFCRDELAASSREDDTHVVVPVVSQELVKDNQIAPARSEGVIPGGVVEAVPGQLGPLQPGRNSREAMPDWFGVPRRDYEARLDATVVDEGGTPVEADFRVLPREVRQDRRQVSTGLAAIASQGSAGQAFGDAGQGISSVVSGLAHCRKTICGRHTYGNVAAWPGGDGVRMN